MVRLRVPAPVAVLLWTATGLGVLTYTARAIVKTSDGDGSYLDRNPPGSGVNDSVDGSSSNGNVWDQAFDWVDPNDMTQDQVRKERERQKQMREEAASYYSQLHGNQRPSSEALHQGKF